MSLDCLWLLSYREAKGLMVRPCLLPVVCMLRRLRSPWGPCDLEQWGTLRVQAVPRKVGDTLPE